MTDAERYRYAIELHSWERPIEHPLYKERDIATAPYGRQEKRVVNHLRENGLGGGDDPVGFLIASAIYVASELKQSVLEIDRLNAEIAQLKRGVVGQPEAPGDALDRLLFAIHYELTWEEARSQLTVPPSASAWPLPILDQTDLHPCGVDEVTDQIRQKAKELFMEELSNDHDKEFMEGMWQMVLNAEHLGDWGMPQDDRKSGPCHFPITCDACVRDEFLEKARKALEV